MMAAGLGWATLFPVVSVYGVVKHGVCHIHYPQWLHIAAVTTGSSERPPRLPPFEVKVYLGGLPQSMARYCKNVGGGTLPNLRRSEIPFAARSPRRDR